MNFLANSLNVSNWCRALLVLIVVGFISPVYADTPLRMVLNWSYQGPQAWFS